MIELILEKHTGETPQFWMDFIGNTIPKYTRPSDNPLHGLTESNGWMRDLSDAIWERVKTRIDLTYVDENIVCAKVMSLIVTLWSSRIIRAKAYDPRRPVEQRREALSVNVLYHTALIECISDESHDHEYFPKQQWDAPFAPEAKDGDFV